MTPVQIQTLTEKQVKQFLTTVVSSGSRISCLGGGGADLRRGHSSAKTYAKMKELDPVGQGGGHAPAAPRGSANGSFGKKNIYPD